MKFSLIAPFCALLRNRCWAGSDWRASISVSEEYNDNVEEERDGEEDFITTVTPALGYRYEDHVCSSTRPIPSTGKPTPRHPGPGIQPRRKRLRLAGRLGEHSLPGSAGHLPLGQRGH
jgi:hypothetical protein